MRVERSMGMRLFLSRHGCILVSDVWKIDSGQYSPSRD
jgi:hypothetical protein